MSKKHYDEAKVIRILSKKNAIRIVQNGTTKYIQILKGNTEVGNGSWGKIDYLQKVHGYYPIVVSEFTSGGNKAKSNSDDTIERDDTKAAKRERKLNMATMAKAAMKRVRTK